MVTSTLPLRHWLRWLTGALLLLVLLRPSSAHAIPEQDWEGPDGVDYSEWNLIGSCIGLTQVVDANCMADKNQKEMARDETKGLARWVQGGLLMWGQLLAGVDIIKETWHYGKKIAEYVEVIAKGFDAKRPSSTAVRLAGASDRIEFMLDGAQRLGERDEFGRVERYNDIEALVMRALSVGKDADIVAVQISDQSYQTQMRLSPDGRVNVYDALDGGTGMRELGMPPLPEDAPPGALAMAGMPAGPMGVAASGYQGLSADGFSVLARTSGESGADLYAACAVPEDNEPEPQTTYYRAMQQATGAQMATTAAVADVNQVNEQLKAIAAQEAALERESKFIALMRSFRL